MKTDLAKILSISGQHGLFEYVAQARNGVIIESLADKKRTLADAKSRITTLADISIYTTEGEIKLQEVFLKMREVLGDADAPSSKAAPEEFRNERRSLRRQGRLRSCRKPLFQQEQLLEYEPDVEAHTYRDPQHRQVRDRS